MKTLKNERLDFCQFCCQFEAFFHSKKLKISHLQRLLDNALLPWGKFQTFQSTVSVEIVTKIALKIEIGKVWAL